MSDVGFEEHDEGIYINVIEPTVVTLQPGDILHVRVGIIDMGDGQAPWIPSPDELDFFETQWAKVVPEGVKVVATHFGVDVTIVPVEIPEVFND